MHTKLSLTKESRDRGRLCNNGCSRDCTGTAEEDAHTYTYREKLDESGEDRSRCQWKLVQAVE